jgi:hypothetical protein
MATDGVKIIDGDLAHDTYWSIMDLYDSNVEIKTIKEQIPFVRIEYGIEDDFYHEIFVTSYALAFWEIGELTNKILDEVNSVNKVGAGVKVWTEQADLKEGKARQKELDKLLKKISEPNAKIRKRKKYRKITNFYIQVDDLLTFKLKDNFYRVVVCNSINQYRGECSYLLTQTTYKSKTKPTVEDLHNYHIAGITVGAGYDRETIIEMQPEVDKLWNLYSYIGEFFLGIENIGIGHQHFLNFKSKFEVIGKLKIKEGFKRGGTLCYVDNFEKFENMLNDYDDEKKILANKRFPIGILCE